MGISVNSGTMMFVVRNGKIVTLVSDNSMMDLDSQEFALEVEGKSRISIEWFLGTNEHGDCLYGFTPFGAYTLYEHKGYWIVSSMDGMETIVEGKMEGIRAINMDFRSRVFELRGRPFVPSERIEGSWKSWSEDGSEEFEIGGECGTM